jgi:hypothetical protein
MLNQEERDRIGEKLTEFSMMISVIEKTFPGTTGKKILDSLDRYFADRKNKIFPSVIALRDYLDPVLSNEARALEITSRLVQSISKFGYSNPEGAKQHVGEIGWLAVRRWGGWAQICQQHGVTLDANQFFAQTRNMVLGFIEQEKNGMLNDRKMLEFAGEKKLLNQPIFTEEETEKLSKELAHLPKSEMEKVLEKIAESRVQKRKEEAENEETDRKLTRIF